MKPWLGLMLLCASVSAAQMEPNTIYRCTDPLPLNLGLYRLRARQFESAFVWTAVRNEYIPAPVEFDVTVGPHESDPRLEGYIADKGGKWRVQLGTESLHSSQLQALDQLLDSGQLVSPAKERMAIMQASSAFHIFGSDIETFVIIKPYVPSRAWLNLAVDFKAFASVDRSYAVLLAGNLQSVAVCLPLRDGQGEMMDGMEVRSAAFRFLADVRHWDLLTCEGFLNPHPVLF